MAYKRYVKRKGKVYGPYIYRNVRDKDGKVKNIFIGKHVQEKPAAERPKPVTRPTEPKTKPHAEKVMPESRLFKRNLYLTVIIILIAIAILSLLLGFRLVRFDLQFKITGVGRP